jgi:quinol-cytochrome oxidoreductase complex cytochrome b subunit
MNRTPLHTIWFAICIVCIVVGTILGLSLIWGSGESEINWKGLGTVGILFLASSLTLAVSNTLEQRSR